VSERDPVLGAARVLVQSCVVLRPGERLLVLCDGPSQALADGVVRAVQEAEGWARTIQLDAFPRPLPVLPDEVLAALAQSEASCFLAESLPRELGARQQLLHLVKEHRLRHAHMPGASEATFVRGLALDYGVVRALGEAALRVLQRSEGVLRVRSEAGTDLSVTVEGGTRWYPQLGRLEPGRWGNLPAGALYATPGWVSGVLVVDGSLGEFFGAKEGVLTEKPVVLRVDGGRVVEVDARAGRSRSAARELEEAMHATLRCGPNSDRIGLVAVGVNEGIDGPTGRTIVDQNLPGLHVGIGDPAAHATGASWTAPTAFAACLARSEVAVDGKLLVRAGRVLA
jgi:leucyl aminopeptidase (aminopeptidase T)